LLRIAYDITMNMIGGTTQAQGRQENERSDKDHRPNPATMAAAFSLPRSQPLFAESLIRSALRRPALGATSRPYRASTFTGVARIQPFQTQTTRRQGFSMAGFKQPDFADRQKAAQQARQNILNKFRSQPGADDPEVIKRRAEREAVAAARAKAKEAREAEKAEQKRREEEAAAAAAAQLAREQEEEAARLAALEAEQKAKRDARYAARKAKGKKR
jgi:hypothetical protein